MAQTSSEPHLQTEAPSHLRTQRAAMLQRRPRLATWRTDRDSGNPPRNPSSHPQLSCRPATAQRINSRNRSCVRGILAPVSTSRALRYFSTHDLAKETRCIRHDVLAAAEKWRSDFEIVLRLSHPFTRRRLHTSLCPFGCEPTCVCPARACAA